MSHTLVAFHAHPDDEALLTAGTMAKAAAAGHRVVLVVATSGEVGDADTEALEHGETLAERRRRETLASAEALGVARVEFLGYGDSGLDGASPAPGTIAFCQADLDEEVAALAAILTEERADVLTTYDRNGGYGHPDHRRVHQVGALAATRAGTPVVLEATVHRDVIRAGLELVRGLGYELPPEWSPDDVEAWFSAGDAITHTIDVSEHLAAKRASMAAHASQATSAVSSTRTLAQFLSLPEPFYALAFGTEWFVEHGRSPDDAADDVFATLADGA